MKRKWASLAVACAATLLLSLDLTVLHLALPKLVADLDASATQLLWIGDVYGFALAGLLITMGNLGDRIGRKKLLLIGAVAFSAASALTAYAPNPELLIAARALLGVAGATIMPSTLSIVRNVFTDPAERTAAVGLWSGMSAAGFAVGPVVGGLMLDHFWWGSVFLINLPIMAVVVVAGAVVLPESRGVAARRIDLASVALSMVGVIAVIYAVKEASVAPGVLGVAALALFAWRQTRLDEPLIDVRLFRRRAFSASILTNLLAMFVMMAMSLMFAWYFQLVLGWSPLQAGLAGLPGGLSGALGGVLAARLIPALGRNGVVAFGLVLTSVAFGSYYFLGTETAYLPLFLAMLVGGAGIGLTFTVNNDNVLATAPKERAGAAAAVSETAFELGGSLGIAILGTVLNTVYGRAMNRPGETLAETLQGTTSPEVIRQARSAFVEGVHVTALTTAGTLLVVAALALFWLRGVPKVIEEEALVR
ncbi:MFS transporter [Nonomuraea sp. NPDC050556]|uniref:MFS transporter n=1 Tax=Nonomuraea sp. NPDC050556 TaxID=3364369 RepID=UPI0037ACE7E9